MSKQMPYLESLLQSKKERSADKALEMAEEAYQDLVDRKEGCKRTLIKLRRAMRAERQREGFDVDTLLTQKRDIANTVEVQNDVNELMKDYFPEGEPVLPEGAENK